MKRKLPSQPARNRLALGRKLHHTVMALAATAGVFAALLLAGTPPTAPAPRQVDILMTSAEASAVIDAAIDVAADADHSQDDAKPHGQPRRSRAFLALPYFSFAQGLRNSRS